MRLFLDSLVQHARRVHYCYLSGEQYNAEFKQRLSALGCEGAKFERLLDKVFFNALLPAFQDHRIAVIVASRKPLDDEIKLQAVREPDNVYRGAVIHASSNVEVGLQLADLAAYLLNRVFHVVERQRRDVVGPFDGIVAAGYEQLQPKLVDLLTPRGRPPSGGG